MALKEKFIKHVIENYFQPKWHAIIFNPCFITRRQLFKNIQSFSEQCREKKILDLGCGTKPYQSLFIKSDYIGIDIAKTGNHDKRMSADKFFDGQSIPYGDNEFDVIVSTQVFEHVEFLEKLFKEIRRVLRPGGYLYFTMPFVWGEHESPYDFRRFTSFGNKQILSNNNFKIISIKPTTGVFGTTGQLISAFFVNREEGQTDAIKIKSKLFRNIINQIIVIAICFPTQLLFIVLDCIFNKKGITLDYVVIAQKCD